MGIDWEEILDAEGEDMAEAYDDAIPQDEAEPAPDGYYNTDREPDDCEDDLAIPEDYDGLLELFYQSEEYSKEIAGNFESAQMVMSQQLKDLKKLLVTLKEHNIEIPEGIEDRYRKLPTYGLYGSYKNFEVEEETKDRIRKEAVKADIIPAQELGDDDMSEEDLELFK